jgi:pantoate--beta-alanine ligase
VRVTRVVRDLDEMRRYVRMLRKNKFTIGLVPTMGALHEGHRSLMRRSFRENDRTVVSIYVNPLQFGPGEDFERYPRDLEQDLAACRAEKADVVFAPPAAQMNPPGRTTTVRVAGVSEDYEGAERPGHFTGVATIVATLFNIAQPDRGYFGQKDYQQTVVVRRMTRDLAFPVDVVVCPIVRDPDGLALSSRNVYLTPEDRKDALRLPGALGKAEQAVMEGETDAGKLRKMLRAGMRSKREDVTVDYADVVHPETLVPLGAVEGHAVLIAVLRVGRTRLLDNRIVAPPGTAAWEG